VSSDVTGMASMMLLGYRVDPRLGKDSEEHRTAVEASPVSHVTSDDPPMLLIHGDADKLVPIEGSRVLRDKLKAAGVITELIKVDGGDHGPHFPGAKQELDDIYKNAVRWMDTHLRRGNE